MQRRAVVIGAGVSGLAAARGLLALGWRVEVHERAAGLPVGGSSLAMWPAAVAALQRLWLTRVLSRAATTTAGVAVLRPDGDRLLAGGSRTSLRLVERPALLSGLAEGLPDGTVRWSHDVSDREALTAVGEGADLLVGADGISSPVRRLLLGGAARRTTARALGTIAVRGTALLLPPAHALAPGRRVEVVETWGRGAMWGTTPRSDGLTNTYACLGAHLLAEAEADPVGVLQRAFAGWHPGVSGPLATLDPSSLDVRPLLDLPRLSSVVTVEGPGAPAVVLGDAAHAMAPHLGRGACEALLDADALCRHLAAAPGGSVRKGLERYDRERRWRGHRAVAGSRVLHDLSTARRGAGLRDACLALAGTAASLGARSARSARPRDAVGRAGA